MDPLSMIEDPLFEPWSVDVEPPRTLEPSPPSTDAAGDPAAGVGATVEFLRSAAVALLDAVATRLRLSRHETSLHDLLDEPPHLLRFELKPWPGPFSEEASQPVSMLEIGLSSESGGAVTAWHWRDRTGEAPDEVASIPSSELTASWLEDVILDFVAKVLTRS